jgi:hypothetical protein
MPTKPHECRESNTCKCHKLGSEPNQDCPIHGWAWPPRCGECGRFMPRPKGPTEEEVEADWLALESITGRGPDAD